MEQMTFAELEHDGKKRKTRRERFLEKMDGLIPWEALAGRIEPFYPKPGRGRLSCPSKSELFPWLNHLRRYWQGAFYH